MLIWVFYKVCKVYFTPENLPLAVKIPGHVRIMCRITRIAVVEVVRLQDHQPHGNNGANCSTLPFYAARVMRIRK